MGRNIRRYRDQRGMSTRRLAEMLDGVGLSMSQSMLSRIENGHRTVTVEHLSAFAEVLDVAPSDLLEEPTATTSPETVRFRLDRQDVPSAISPEVMEMLAGIALITPETSATLARIGSLGIASMGEELTRRIEPLLRHAARQHPRPEIERDTGIADDER